eukprot:m.77724 g.77724  ORF g.77724 m.77724 type:complete len:266 (+) comp12639_c0_seq1:419-1216(+)
MSGFGSGPSGGSWNGAGSTASPGAKGPTCDKSAQNYCSDYESCHCPDDDNCWWTTCLDSVAQVIHILDEIEFSLCIDKARIWISGCSNGGIFLYELAKDTRIAHRLAGIIPIVGLPHNGFNKAPLNTMHFLGIWGTKDTTVPPIDNDGGDSDISAEKNGWYYTTADAVLRLWRRTCSAKLDIPSKEELSSGKMTCSKYCSDTSSGQVMGCFFEAGHYCSKSYIWDQIFSFIQAWLTTFINTFDSLICSTYRFVQNLVSPVVYPLL